MTIGEANEAAASMEEPIHDRSFLGHPKGLGFVLFKLFAGRILAGSGESEPSPAAA